jgi:ATP-dependent protease HslVU (ClpYQ) peptidase subunit
MGEMVAMSANERTADSEQDGGTDNERIGGEPIDGDGIHPFAGLTRFDEDVDAVSVPEQVFDRTSSMQCWAREQVGAHAGVEDGGEETIDRDLDPGVLPERGLRTVITELPRANHAVPAWIHPRTGKVYETAKHSAVINPEKAEAAVGGYGTYAEAIADVTDRDEKAVAEDLTEMSVADYMGEYLTDEQREQVTAAGIGDDALYQIAGDDHTIINPQQPLEELCNVIQDEGLSDKVFGEVSIDRNGGRATLDVFFEGRHVESPVLEDDRDPIVVGLQVQWSFYSDWAFRICGQGIDWDCVNRIHRMTDRETVKYAGDVEGRVEWREMFEEVLGILEQKRQQLGRIIKRMSDETLDFGDLPSDIDAEFRDEDAAPWVALYSYMGLPTYLSRHAGKRLRSQADDAYEPNWWEIHSAATYAVTHHDRGDRTSGGSFEDHARVANDMLFNPSQMEERMVTNYEADRLEDEQSTLAEEGGGTADIQTAFESVREKQEQYEEWERELTQMGVEL